MRIGFGMRQKMEMRMELHMVCQLCDASIGGGFSNEELMQLALFGHTKYGKCPHCGHPKELYHLSKEKQKAWKDKVDIYLLGASGKKPDVTMPENGTYEI